MTAELVSSKYVPSIGGGLIQGVKGNRVPKGALYGGNGSFVMMGSPNEARIVVKDVATQEYHEYDIRNQVKYDVFDGGKVTEKRIKTVFSALGQAPFEISSDGEITNLRGIYSKYKK